MSPLLGVNKKFKTSSAVAEEMNRVRKIVNRYDEYLVRLTKEYERLLEEEDSE